MDNVSEREIADLFLILICLKISSQDKANITKLLLLAVPIILIHKQIMVIKIEFAGTCLLIKMEMEFTKQISNKLCFVLYWKNPKKPTNKICAVLPAAILCWHHEQGGWAPSCSLSAMDRLKSNKQLFTWKRA